MMTTLKLLKISESSALEKMELERVVKIFITRDVSSIESLLDSWHREATSRLEMVWEEKVSMVKNSLTKTWTKESMTKEESFPWQMLAKIPMDPSSSFVS